MDHMGCCALSRLFLQSVPKEQTSRFHTFQVPLALSVLKMGRKKAKNNADDNELVVEKMPSDVSAITEIRQKMVRVMMGREHEEWAEHMHHKPGVESVEHAAAAQSAISVRFYCPRTCMCTDEEIMR